MHTRDAFLTELVPPARTFSPQQLLRLNGDHPETGPVLYCAGDLDLLKRPAIAVVGARKASPAGLQRARQLCRDLVARGIVVVSGLAMGIDTVAHETAIACGGHTCAVVATPLDRVTPISNAELQEAIYREHLLVSPFKLGDQVYRSNFPARNKIMAALTDATVIIEAGETSGTLHQATECARLGRPVLIPESLLTEHRAEWPKRFLDAGEARLFQKSEEVIAAVMGA